MAGRKNTKKSQKKRERVRRKFALPALLLVIALLMLCTGWMYAGANITRLRYADLYLQDLPAELDGTTALFISDFNIRNEAEGRACIRLMNKMQQLNPDMLLLGGDYSAVTLLSALNGAESADFHGADRFLRALSDFNAPLGKFAVCGERDIPEKILNALADTGVQLLSDACAVVEKDGGQLVIAGLDDVSTHKTPYEEIGGYFSGDECVLVLAHNPSAYVGVRVAEARGGGAWADAVLSGHTLGGQIRIGNRTLREMPEAEARCLAGWYYADDLPMLVSQGLGCSGAKLRLGTQSEVWLITLKKPQSMSLPDFN